MAQVEVSQHIGTIIKNVSSLNDRKNINFDIQIHGEWVRILDCPSHRNTEYKRRRFVQLQHMVNNRDWIYKKHMPKPNLADPNEAHLFELNLKQFKKDGIKKW